MKHLLSYENLYEGWITQCEKMAQQHNVPIRKWIEEKPSFQFSIKHN